MFGIQVLQKLGKADETKDEQFEQVVINFRRQECEGSRLQREMKAYMSAIKGMQQASINLTQSLHEVYEPDWHGKDDVLTIGKDCDALWENFHNKLVDSTLLNLDAYLLQFPDLKTRVAKRSRKLIDYDSARHHVETLQTSGMKNDRKMLKADEELRKAQRVFDELNAGLQDQLPTLWDSRVGFYISTFKSVTSLEARFHREISLVCKQLYEVMMQLSEQHADKMFTIQGAPSDSGPLRLARTPSPPEYESPPESPDASSNHMLRPVSPGPPRPKSPMQMKKGPPVPPPPKVTPSKEVVVEEQIIDLFGGEFLPAPSALQPNERPGESLLDMDFDAFQPDESVSPVPQTAVPWDTWSASESGFVADWSADFGSVATDGEAAPGEAATGPPERTEQGDQGGEGDRVTSPPPLTPSTKDSEEAEDEASEMVNPAPPAGEEPLPVQPAAEENTGVSPGSPVEEKPSDLDSVPVEKKQSPTDETPESMAIPSVVIEPASSNEGDDDRDTDIISPSAIGDNGGVADKSPIKPTSSSPGGLPDDFLYKVETMHDFEAANSDELDLKQGDVVLVVPTASVEDQEAGWLTGFKQSDWTMLGIGAQKGLFPENFTQRLE
ncbi:amphiphysin isoform X2 [Syngnathoides biaculeatus]|uniref:amphiphysin isoform X2 n=1 Tax=Syngnathoides biaculeatus TaxID=300417 RepID=UPI002ADD57F5|nr:amphiphysin isoform X2 [Syngnathoides biaculeatus]